MTLEASQKLLELVASGHVLEGAARLAGLSIAEIKSDPKLMREVAEADMAAISTMRAKLLAISWDNADARTLAKLLEVRQEEHERRYCQAVTGGGLMLDEPAMIQQLRCEILEECRRDPDVLAMLEAGELFEVLSSDAFERIERAGDPEMDVRKANLEVEIAENRLENAKDCGPAGAGARGGLAMPTAADRRAGWSTIRWSRYRATGRRWFRFRRGLTSGRCNGGRRDGTTSAVSGRAAGGPATTSAGEAEGAGRAEGGAAGSERP
jgi:hypothetical protein